MNNLTIVFCLVFKQKIVNGHDYGYVYIFYEINIFPKRCM